jgi:hypothetical protein
MHVFLVVKYIHSVNDYIFHSRIFIASSNGKFPLSPYEIFLHCTHKHAFVYTLINNHIFS